MSLRWLPVHHNLGVAYGDTGRNIAEGDRERCSEEIICAYDGRGDRAMKKTHMARGLLLSTSQQVLSG